MKEIFLISYYNSTTESIFHLRKLVEELSVRGKNFIISSHSTVPQDLIEKSKGYLYDPVNHIIDVDPFMYFWSKAGNMKIHSKFLCHGSVAHKSYGVAAVKNILNGLQLANSLEYDIIHSLEYDCIPNFEDLENNYLEIKENKTDCVVYKEANLEMLGNVFTLRSKKESLFNLSNSDLELLFSEYSFFSERALFNLCVKWFGKNRICIKNKNVQPHGKITSLDKKDHIESVIFMNPSNNLASVFLENTSQYKKEIFLYSKFGRNILEFSPFSWKIIDLGEISELDFVDIYVNDILVRKWDLSSTENIEKYVYSNKIEIN